MKTPMFIRALIVLLITTLTLAACSSNESEEIISQIPNGEVVTIKSAAPERDFSLFVVADRDDYGQKDMEFYVSAESPAELHDLIKANVGKKIRIAWAEGLISAAEELQGNPPRFAGSLPQEANEEVSEGDPPSDTILQELASLADLEKDITYGEKLNAVVSSISTYSPRNLQIVATCLSASRIYRTIALAQMGEAAWVSDGSPSAADADKIHGALLNLTVDYGRQLDDKETFDAVLKTLDEEAFNHFYLPADEGGNREFNIKVWANWYGVPMVSICRNIVAPFLDQGVDPMGIAR
jgi:hypothetical protein